MDPPHPETFVGRSGCPTERYWPPGELSFGRREEAGIEAPLAVRGGHDLLS